MTISAPMADAIQQRAEDEATRTGYPDGFPVLPAVAADRYHDADFAALERRSVFGRSWLFVAHTDELAEPGSYRLLTQLDAPIMVLRDQDGTIRAFYNTCKHRGSALVNEASGNIGRRLTCPYHNWVYDLSGELVGYPDANDFGERDRDCLALTSIRCETWGPLVFINLDPDAPGLRDFLGAVGDDLSEIEQLEGRMRLADHTARDVPVNWKLPVDANLETYHVNYVHKDSAALALHQPSTGIQLLGNGHSRMLIRTHKGIAFDTPFPALFDGLGELPRLGTFSYHVFPNLSIVFAGLGFVFFITNWPDGPDSSTYHVHWCSSLDPTDERYEKRVADFVSMNQNVLFEDLDVLPGIQKSIAAGALERVWLNYQERRIYHLHEAIDRAIGSELVPDELRVPQILGTYVEG